MSYVASIEPRLTPHRPAAPVSAAETLQEWSRDLEQELLARLRLLSPAELEWQPHPDSNNVAVTVWHVCRWLDVLGTRAFTGAPATHDLWHRHGWRDRTGYEPDGLGYLGLGALTGYTPEQMRAAPTLDAVALADYLGQTVAALVRTLGEFGPHLLRSRDSGPSPYQSVGSTLQGSFGHVGEIDALVALKERLHA